MLAALQRVRRDIHPDRNGGTFPDLATKAKWHQVNEAIAFLANYNASPAPMDAQSRELTNPESRLLANADLVSVSERTITRRAAFVAAARSRAGSRVVIPRISSATLAAVCAFLFTAGPTLDGHPFLSRLTQMPLFYEFTGSLCLYSAIFFVLTWTSEQAAASRAEFQSSDAGLLELASRFTPAIFRRSELIAEIRGHERFLVFLAPFIRRMDAQTASDIADLHIERMLTANVIERIAEPTLDPRYRFIADV